MASSGVHAIDGGGVEVEQKRTCFLVTPLGDEDGEIRKRSDHVRTYIIEEALGPLGFTMSRSDLTNVSGDITEQIVNELLNADLVVADLTDHNPNVFYEIALRHAFGKPFIHIAQKGQRLPFDIAQQRTVFYDLTDLPTVYAAKKAIQEAAEEILAGGDQYKVVSPVTRSVDINTLRRSGDPEQLAIADIKQSLDELRSEFRAAGNPDTPRLMVNAGGRTMPYSGEDIVSLRKVLVHLAAHGRLHDEDLQLLAPDGSSKTMSLFARQLAGKFPEDSSGTRTSASWRGANDASESTADRAGTIDLTRSRESSV